MMATASCLRGLAAAMLGLSVGIGASFASGAAPADKMTPKVADALSPLPPDAVRFTGWLGQQLETCRQGRMLAQSIPDLIRPFRQRQEDRFWQCEFWGKWFTSAVLACRYQRDAAMQAVVDRAVTELIKTQTPDGYLGTYKTAAQTKGWDIWGRKYVLLGLLAYYDLTGDTNALKAASREADYTLGQLGPGKADIVACGMWTGMAASSILEPMVLLYRRTGEPRYLEFAKYIVDDWKTPNGPDLLRKALAGTPVYQMFPGPDKSKKGYMSGGMSKAYEMMSCYEGLLELYRVTGTPEYAQAAKNAAASIRNTEITIIGSGSSWERWCNGHTRQVEDVPEWMETCVGVTWLKLSAQLLRLTGNPQYADQIERTAYNSLAAAQKDDGTWWCHYNPLEGIRQPAPEQCQIHMNCCVANGPRALMLLPMLAVMRDAAGPVVNFYEPGSAEVPLDAGSSVKLRIEGDYPRSGDVTIAVAPQAPGEFTLALRIPSWSRETKAVVDGKPIADVQPGKYLRVHRRWEAGDEVRLHFDMTTRAVHDPGGSERVAIVRGPVVMALDKRITASQPGLGPARIVAGNDGAVAAKVVREALPAKVLIALDVPMATADGRTATVRMCDYASAGHTWGPDSLFRVWLPQPLDLADPLAGVAAAAEKH